MLLYVAAKWCSFCLVIVSGCQFPDFSTFILRLRSRYELKSPFLVDTHTRWESWRFAFWWLETELQLSDHTDGSSRNWTEPGWLAPYVKLWNGNCWVFGWQLRLLRLVDSNCIQDLDWPVLLSGNVAFMRLKNTAFLLFCFFNIPIRHEAGVVVGVCMQPCGPNDKKATTYNQTQTARININFFDFYYTSYPLSAVILSYITQQSFNLLLLPLG